MSKSKPSPICQNIEVEVTQEAEEQAKNQNLTKKLEKAIRLYKANPWHPSLHNELLKPESMGRHSIMLNDQYRAKYIKIDANKIRIYYVGDYHGKKHKKSK
jgi:plasmid maintenance system killer protein